MRQKFSPLATRLLNEMSVGYQGIPDSGRDPEHFPSFDEEAGMQQERRTELEAKRQEIAGQIVQLEQQEVDPNDSQLQDLYIQLDELETALGSLDADEEAAGQSPRDLEQAQRDRWQSYRA